MIKAILGVIWIKTLFFLLWVVLFVWALTDILGSRKKASWKILWVIVCLILPILGVILYALLGREK